MAKTTTFTSESVCAGHPDKICDAISDAILDAVIASDPKAHTGIETLATTNHVTVAGEVKVKNGVVINYEKIVRNVIRDLGYTTGEFGFDYKAVVNVLIHQQNQEIARGVDIGGAGDQGMMFGFACRQTPELMPMPIMIAHDLARKIDEMREEKILDWLRPDGKSQVTVEYRGGKPLGVRKVVIAVPHGEKISDDQVKEEVFRNVVCPVLEKYRFKISRKALLVNGTGTWHIGGPATDTGVTGRKIVVDTYGGFAPVGGGCFSGKDPTKVDRSGAYAARFIAKNIVANNLAQMAEVRLAYFIGAKAPIMQEVETFGTEKTSRKVIRDFCAKILDTSVEGILEGLGLRRPIYLPTAAYGHFGREEFPWEKIV